MATGTVKVITHESVEASISIINAAIEEIRVLQATLELNQDDMYEMSSPVIMHELQSLLTQCVVLQNDLFSTDTEGITLALENIRVSTEDFTEIDDELALQTQQEQEHLDNIYVGAGY